MPLSTSQGDNEYQLEQASPTSDEWSIAGGGPQPSASSAQWPQEASTPQVTHRPAGTGLLSKWKFSQLQLQQSQYATGVSDPVQQRTSLVEQDTLAQPAVQRPITDPKFNVNVAQAFAV